MKINEEINTTIITDNNLEVLSFFKNKKIINAIEEIKNINTNFIIFNDVLRYLRHKELVDLLSFFKEKSIHFVNITSNSEEVLLTPYLMVWAQKSIQIEGETLSVLKEERILKRLGFKLPFMFDISLQLNYYNLINKIYLDEKNLIEALW